MRGRKPHAQAVLKASGALKKHPERENKHEPKPCPEAPEKPMHIGIEPTASKYWDHLVEQLADMKILTKADRSIMEVFCETMALRKQAFVDKEISDYIRLATLCKGYLSELGLTPSSRSRLVVKDTEVEDEYQSWQKGFSPVDNK